MKTLTCLVSTILFALTAVPSLADDCGQPLTDGNTPRAVDALHILGAAVGTRQCTLAACDVNTDCSVSASDALRTLVASVGGEDTGDCDSNCPTEIPCEEAGASICNGLCPAGMVCTVDADGEVEPDERATVCHVPPGNHANAHTIVVGVPAVSAHLRHGDYLGPCDGDDDASCDGIDCEEPTCDGIDCENDADSDSDSDSDSDLACVCEPGAMIPTTTLPDDTTTTTTTTTTTITTTTVELPANS